MWGFCVVSLIFLCVQRFESGRMGAIWSVGVLSWVFLWSFVRLLCVFLSDISYLLEVEVCMVFYKERREQKWGKRSWEKGRENANWVRGRERREKGCERIRE